MDRVIGQYHESSTIVAALKVFFEIKLVKNISYHCKTNIATSLGLEFKTRENVLRKFKIE